MAALSADIVAQLQAYTACDVSDALLKLKVPGAGFIADLNLYTTVPSPATAPVVAPISTVLFVAAGETPVEPASNIPDGFHWSDITEPGSFVIIRQPPGQTNAVCGGLVAKRIGIRDAKGIAVAGRVRDLLELRGNRIPIMAYGTSTVGAGGSSTAWAVQVPLDINGVFVNPGDVAFCDSVNGLVVIPQRFVPKVLEMLPALTQADQRVGEALSAGLSLSEAFSLHRGT